MTVNSWDADLYVHTWNFASQAHGKQKMSAGDIPYINHIGNVAMEVLSAIAQGELNSFNEANLAMQCALLHDTIEDTYCSYQDIYQEFGVDIADGVLALTKDTSLASKQEQMLDSLLRIKKQPKSVWLVKLADRITNLQSPPAHWDKQKASYYKQEAQIIFEHLHQASSFLAMRLQDKINNYQKYIDLLTET